MLLIDEHGTVIQGFIPPARIDTYLPHMKAGSVYRLNKCFGSNSKVMYRVAEPSVVISFTSNSVLSDLEDSRVNFPDDRFRFHSYEEFEAACDLKGDLYDYVGHLKLVNGQTLNDSVVLDEEEIASTRRLLLHVQTHDGPVMKLYLWNQAAADFCAKFKSHGSTQRVILVTTVNPKCFGGALALASMSSSRVFLDFDVQPTRDYVTWLDSNLDVANRVDAKVATKTETMTIAKLFSYIKQEAAKTSFPVPFFVDMSVSDYICLEDTSVLRKVSSVYIDLNMFYAVVIIFSSNFCLNTQVAWFECTTTVDAVFHGSPWYYIGCGVCHTKATKGPTSLMCKKCGKHEVDGVPQYLTKLFVYDNNDQAVFVILGEAGRELTGKQASELVESYFEANESMGDDHLITVPQTLVDTIGRTYRFIVKVSYRNLKGHIHTLTVTKVLPLDAPGPVEALVETVSEEPVDGRVKRGSDLVESGEAKRAKSGN
ncbi:hypothetical protein Bca101_051037 [Brassica carinata]